MLQLFIFNEAQRYLGEHKVEADDATRVRGVKQRPMSKMLPSFNKTFLNSCHNNRAHRLPY